MFQVTLSWVEYWKRFQELHGGNPVVYKDRFLFSDGWTYSMTNHAGPEWPPPEDPVPLIRAYWTRRQMIVTAELDEFEGTVQNLREQMRTRSAPMQRLVRGEDGKMEAIPLDLDDFSERQRWLMRDVAQCQEKLDELDWKGVPSGVELVTEG